MAVAVEMSFKGGTLEQYDQVTALMGFPEKPLPAGAIFHWAAATEDGLRVVDVWETKEQFEQFAQDEIGPYTQQVGMPGPPEITFREVHHYMAAR